MAGTIGSSKGNPTEAPRQMHHELNRNHVYCKGKSNYNFHNKRKGNRPRTIILLLVGHANRVSENKTKHP